MVKGLLSSWPQHLFGIGFVSLASMQVGRGASLWAQGLACFSVQPRAVHPVIPWCPGALS